MTFQTRAFARSHGIACIRELTRYLNSGVLPEELLDDLVHVIAAGVSAAELGGGNS